MTKGRHILAEIDLTPIRLKSLLIECWQPLSQFVMRICVKTEGRLDCSPIQTPACKFIEIAYYHII